jgi:hypothetical protein
VPLILTSHYRRYKVFPKARCVFDIHNMGYQVPNHAHIDISF